MPNLPLRNLGDVGVIADQAAFNLPINAYTRAKNVRFDQGNITRSPAFRDVKDITTFTPVFINGLYSASGYDSVLIVDDQYNVHTMTNHVITADYQSNATASSAPVHATKRRFRPFSRCLAQAYPVLNPDDFR